MSLPSPHGDGAKTQGHALYNRPLDAHARRRKRLGTSQEESKIFVYFILKFLDLFIEEILFPVFAGAIFSDTDIIYILLTKSKFSTNKAK